MTYFLKIFSKFCDKRRLAMHLEQMTYIRKYAIDSVTYTDTVRDQPNYAYP